MSSKKGFTLIELLVVISIIGILATLLMANFFSAAARARDAVRKSDIKQLQKALELYSLNLVAPDYPLSNNFPPPKGSCWYAPNLNNPNGCPANVTIYMSNIPADPKAPFTPYFYQRTGQGTYNLCACLENSADPDGRAGICPGATAAQCPSSRRYLINEP